MKKETTKLSKSILKRRKAKIKEYNIVFTSNELHTITAGLTIVRMAQGFQKAGMKYSAEVMRKIYGVVDND